MALGNHTTFYISSICRPWCLLLILQEHCVTSLSKYGQHAQSFLILRRLVLTQPLTFRVILGSISAWMFQILTSASWMFQLEISAFWMALRDSLFAVDAVFGINLSLSLTFCGWMADFQAEAIYHGCWWKWPGVYEYRSSFFQSEFVESSSQSSLSDAHLLPSKFWNHPGLQHFGTFWYM